MEYLTEKQHFSKQVKEYKLNGGWRSYLYCTVITACADELGSTTGWIASVHKGGVSFQTLDPLTCFTVPHTHGLVRARWKKQAEGCRKNTKWIMKLLKSFNETFNI